MTRQQVAAGLVLAFATGMTQAADRTWTGGGAETLWSLEDNWGGTAPTAGDALFFGGSTKLINQNDLEVWTPFAGITFNSGAGTFVLGGNGITLGGDVVNFDNDVQTLDLPLAFDATRVFNATNGAITINGTLSGSGGFTKSGTRIVTLAGDNSAFEGAVMVTTGRLAITHANALGGTAQGTVINTGAALEIHGGLDVNEPITLVNFNPGSLYFMSGSNTYSGPITITGGQARISNENSPLAHITGGITSVNSTVIFSSGTGNASNLLKISEKPILSDLSQKTFVHGSRTAVLAVGGNVFGRLEVAGGRLLLEVPDAWPSTLQLEVGVSYARNSHIDLQSNSQTIGTLTGPVTNDGVRVITSSTGPATLTVNQSANSEYNSNFAGELSLIKLGSGTLRVTGTNCQQSGRTVIGGGRLGILSQQTLGVNPAAFASDHLVISNGATLLMLGPCVLDDTNRGVTLGAGGGTFEAPSGTNSVVAVPITGVGGLTKAGTGILALTGVNDYEGATAVTAGTLHVGKKASLYNGATLSSGMFTVNSGATLALNVGGTGEFTSGDVATVATLGTDSAGFKPGSWLALNADNAPETTYEISDVLGNPSGGHGLNLEKQGLGTLVVSGMNTYTGATKITQGVLSVPGIANGGVASPLGQASRHRDNLVFAGGTLRYTGPTARTDRGFRYAVNTNVYAFEVTQPDTILTFGSVSNSLYDGSNTTLKKTGPGTIVFGKSDLGGGHGAYSVRSIFLLEGKMMTESGNTIQQNLNCPASSGPALLLGDGVELTYNTPLERYNDRLVRYVGTQTCARLTSPALTLCGPNEYPANTHTFDINDGVDEIDLLITSKFDVYPGATAISDLIKAGGGTLKLAHSQNAYRGRTVIRNGRILVAGNVLHNVVSPLGASTNVVQFGDELSSISDAPVFAFEGTATNVFTFSREVFVYPAGSPATIGGISNNIITFSGPILLSNTLNVASASTGANAVTLSGAASGPGGLTKTGPGVAVLAAANAYEGATTVAEGTLRLGASGRIADASALRLTGGRLELNGFSETVGTLDVDGTAELDFGAGGTLTCADSSAETWDGTLILRGWNKGAGRLFVGDSASLSAAQLAKITSPIGETAAQLSTGEVILRPLGTVFTLR